MTVIALTPFFIPKTYFQFQEWHIRGALNQFYKYLNNNKDKTRTYGPGSIIMDHSLHFKGEWDTMASGLFPIDEVKSILEEEEKEEIMGRLKTYLEKYTKYIR